MDNIIKEFLAESYESLDQLERDLVVLEKDPGAYAVLDAIFRIFHNIKGSAGVLGFARLDSVAHVAESLLSKLRDRELAFNSEIADALLAALDVIRGILSNIETHKDEGNSDNSGLIATLTRLQQENRTLASEKPSENQLEENGGKTVSSIVSESNIRVHVELLDRLMNLVGELVLVRNQILQYAGMQQETNFLGTSQRLNLITTELQEGVMKTRMQPIGNVWDKFPRVVRDLAAASGKQIRLEMEGKETELDKTIIEAIKDPLTHLVRNSVDHGIEPVNTRTTCGKPTEGCIFLRAFHEGGQVNIEITDDGRGISTENIKKKALQDGLITHDQASCMSEGELQNMIFWPGFSTAEKITNVSGRGVGMDVVKTNIEKIGGMIDLQSRSGQGTTFKIKIPLTLAIIPALVVTTGNDRYAIPQVSLLELVRLEGKQAHQRIEMIHDTPVYRLRGRLLPLVFLNKVLKIDPCEENGIVNIVVLQADDRQFGMVVDEINDTQEIVVKPLGKQLKGLPVFAGATIMGDGRVALILDVLGIAQKGNVVSEVRESSLVDIAEHEKTHANELKTMLLFRIGDSRMAIPLSLVARLEEFPNSVIEKAGDYDVVQYRNKIMPLIYLSDFFSPGSVNMGADPMKVIVYAHSGQNVGLVVDKIIDIVEERQKLQKCENRVGVLGSSVIQKFVTDILDLDSIIRAANPPFFAYSQEMEVRV